MKANRRAFLKSSASVAVSVAASASAGATAQPPALRPMTDGIVPITIDDRRARLDKARRLMAENKLDAIFLEGGSSMFYFTGVRWGLSERPFVAVIPAKGELAWVCPGFEEARARELIKFGDDVRTWPLQPGMCFSDEPMIAIYGEFGIRLEDCLYITENGPKFFTQPSPAIDQPFA